MTQTSETGRGGCPILLNGRLLPLATPSESGPIADGPWQSFPDLCQKRSRLDVIGKLTNDFTFDIMRRQPLRELRELPIGAT